MNKILISCMICASLISAQSFEEWQKAQITEYNTYKKTMDEEFASMLKEKWTIFDSNKEKKVYVKPKQKVMPIIKKEIKIKQKEIKASPIVKQKKYPIIKKAKTVINQDLVKKQLKNFKKTNTNYKNISFKFYGEDIHLNYHKKLHFGLNQYNNKVISKTWDKLSRTKINKLTKQINTYVKTLELNDWAKYLFIKRIGNEIYKDKNKSNIFTWYVLSKMSYDIKVGYNQQGIYLLSTINHKLFQVSFFNLSNKRYYVLRDKVGMNRIKKLSIYKGNYPTSINSLSFEIKKPINFNNNIQSKKLSFKFQGKTYNINAKYSKDLVNFYKSFPQSDYKIYFNSKNSTQISSSLLKELNTQLKGKTELEAVNFLLRFTQKSFAYKTDDDQFSYEKVMFPEETIFYPYSDCEDRSIMFSTLVKNLLDLNVVGIKFPDHLATAVELSSHIKGDSFKYKGKRYTISDPTYINANAGMTMPKYKNTSFDIIE